MLTAARVHNREILRLRSKGSILALATPRRG
jgi:hypothetical protein